MKRQGFTLVELLIVIVVIAILAAIVTVAYNGFRSRAQDSAVQSTASQVSKKVELRNVSEGSYICQTCTTQTQQKATYGLDGSINEDVDFYFFYSQVYGKSIEFDRSKVIVIYNEQVNADNGRWLSVSYWSNQDQLWHYTFYRDGNPVSTGTTSEPYTEWAEVQVA